MVALELQRQGQTYSARTSRNVEVLDLVRESPLPRNNELSIRIPTSPSNITSLKELDLGHNDLGGECNVMTIKS